MLIVRQRCNLGKCPGHKEKLWLMLSFVARNGIA